MNTSGVKPTEGPDFVILGQDGTVPSMALIPSSRGANAQRLAELALLLPEKEARENGAIILNQTESGIFILGMLDNSNFIKVWSVARALKVDTSSIESHQLTEKDYDTLLALAYTGELAALVRQEQHEADEATKASREEVSWKDISRQGNRTEEIRVESRVEVEEEARGYRATIHEILREGSRRGASDIHFKPGPIVGGIYTEIDGWLYPYATDVPQPEMERLTRGLADMAGVNDYQLVNKDRDASIDIILPVPGKGDVKTRLRFAAAPCLNGIDITVRLITQEFRDFDEMGHEPEHLEIFDRSLKHRNGLIVVTGETGSGKSTLLEAMTRRLEASGNLNVIVVADPIEYENHTRTQIEIKPNFGWGDALRIALRKAPKIIVVGEIRDEEVANIAFRAAYTGHLVLTTLHTNDVASTFARLTNLGVEPYNQGGLIRSICSQQLVRRLCRRCRIEDPQGPIIAASIAEKLFSHRGDLQAALAGAINGHHPFYRAVGCKVCHYSGYRGRIAVAEVLEVTKDLSSMISLGMKDEQTVEFAVNEYGMLNFRESALRKLIEGITSFAEVQQWLTPAPPRKQMYRSAPNWRPGANNNYGDDDAIDAEYQAA